ncbi:unnamed protein product [Microthlaspi erraticum]|uniref:Lysine ketoglutarate reductase trans-splicing related 1 n=1 Tax=Microthlaspi erraticum TaxID=1685480 RepID=A0A6D2LET1_9BRAS|nr:unnamed protein product [Microthlaspi erraticum]
MGIFSRSSISRKSKDGMKIIATAFFGVTFGFLIGISFPSLSITKVSLPTNFLPSTDLSYIEEKGSTIATPDSHKAWSSSKSNDSSSSGPVDKSKIWVPSNPRGAEMLPPGMVAAESDFYLRRLWGLPHEDLQSQPNYLVTFTVGINQKENIDACVKKFSGNFTILLFHYDGKVSEWDEFEWSKTAIHISVRKQTKWWYAKRFLHPDIVARYDYIFIWDEDLGVEHFNAEEYIKLVKKHGLEISQPGLEPNKGLTWQMTKRRGDLEVHKITEEKPGWCSDPHLPPCAAFVEIMAPVFSRDAWRCVWHMIQNDLVHGWGLDFALRRCVKPAHEKIGVVDSQWVVHQTVPSLGSQGEAVDGKAPWQGVRDRCKKEWTMFQSRMANAEKEYFRSLQVEGSSNSTTATTI